jgi:isocitrate dehydrogenase
VAAIAELQSKGYNVPAYTQDPKTAEEKDFTARYSKVLGSAVNPVLREGNSDRRVAGPVKAYAQKHPHKLGAWPKDSKTKVAHMAGSDFFGSEKSATVAASTSVKIELVSSATGATTVLKEGLKLAKGEVVDASCMSVSALRAFLEQSFTTAKQEGVLASLHLKATMMKISDPILFGHAVTVFYKDLFAKHAALFKELKVNPNNGFGDVLAKIAQLPEAQRKAIEADIEAVYASRPALAMVDSRKGITNLHVPSDVIVDASMPCVVRDSGGMWNRADKLQDTHCIIPDRCYAGIYDVIIKDVQKHGQFSVSSMGSTANVGLMAQKAEEYGSHDKTFQLKEAGTVRVTDAAGQVLFQHSVQQGDIWRMCQTKDAAVKDWVKLAVGRARASATPAIFWLNPARAHDAQIIAKVQAYLKEHDTKGLDISIHTPEAAMAATCARARAGLDTISVTGNVLRDYLTDLFPILELGTSAKMLSIVPMMAGGGMYETGAGGSAPKHVQQFVQEGHLRWDSLGEYLAIAVSLEDLASKTKNERAGLLSKTLLEAISKLLDENKSPSRKVKELDNRGSHFYIALYWADAVAKLDPSFKELAAKLAASKEATLKELIDCQGSAVDIGGYFQLDEAKANKAMRPSATFNKLIDF